MIKLGSRKRDEAENIMGNSILSIVLSGAVLTVVLYIFAEPVMYFLGASATSIDAAVTYMRIYTLGAVAIMGYMGVFTVCYLAGRNQTGNDLCSERCPSECCF